jgi:hypothetical protein
MSTLPASDLRASDGHGTGDGHGAAADAGDVLDRIRRLALLFAGAGVALVLLGLLIHGARAFFQAYLYAYVFWTGLALGCLALLMLQHLVGGAWGAVIQRPLEAGTRVLPVMALLFVPLAVMVAAGKPYIYEWLAAEWREAWRAHDHTGFKLWYLTRAGFIVRALVYFVVWIGLASLLSRWSARQDQSPDDRTVARLQVVSAPGLVLYVVTVSLAVVDWVMSLEPEWYSTLYGLLFVVGQVLGTLAVVVVLLSAISRRRPLAGVLSVGHFHDLGNLLLAFVMLWAYLSFAQFLIIWSGNIAEETPYYYSRTQTGWKYVALVLVMFHFFVPFVLLLWRRTKRNPSALAKVALALLVMRLVDLFWVMGPSFGSSHPRGNESYAAAEAAARGTGHAVAATGGWWHAWMFPAAAAGVGGIWVLVYVSQLRRRPLLPLNDRRLEAAAAGGH